MLTAALVSAALLAGGQVTVIAATPAPAEARPANAPAGPEGDRRRVCRDIARAGAQDQQTREFLRNLQRIRFPDEGATATPGGPNGG